MNGIRKWLNFPESSIMKLQKSSIDFFLITLRVLGWSCETLRETSWFAIAHISHEMGSKKVLKRLFKRSRSPLDLDARVWFQFTFFKAMKFLWCTELPKFFGLPAKEDGPRIPQRKYMAKTICKGLVQTRLRYNERSKNFCVSICIKLVVSPTRKECLETYFWPYMVFKAETPQF